MKEDRWAEMDIGYVFAPQDDAFSIGHPRLEVYIRPEPTLRHYDPETLTVPVRVSSENGMDGTGERTVYHPAVGPRQDRITLGRIILRDRVDAREEAFSFGGTIEITSDPDCTRCSISSQAPILHLFCGETLADFIADEVEVVLAELKGRRAEQLEELDRGLALASPEDLYTTCLWELLERFENFEHRELPSYQELLQLLQQEIKLRQAAGEWPPKTPSLERLLLGQQA